MQLPTYDPHGHETHRLFWSAFALLLVSIAVEFLQVFGILNNW